MLTVIMGIVHCLELSGCFYLGLHRSRTMTVPFFLPSPFFFAPLCGKALFMRHLVSSRNGFKIAEKLIWLDLYSH